MLIVQVHVHVQYNIAIYILHDKDRVSFYYID